MTIRQELLKQAEHKLDKLLEQALEFLVELTGGGEMGGLICRIISTERNASARLKVIRMFADERERQIVEEYNKQQDLPLDDNKGKDSL